YQSTGFFVCPEIKLKNPFLGFRNVYLGTGMMPIYFGGIDPVSEPKTTLSIDDDELPMVRPREEVKVTKQLSID
ncbi:MAG TPA: hypothetical protein PLG47_05440, partial [Candidatus Dojkabacteria bacterium]|nr:hypothetical protein [Candidatus Dojkabacteria bacterium]